MEMCGLQMPLSVAVELSKAVTLACSWQVITAQECILICIKSDILFASISRAQMSLVVVYIL